MSPSLDVVSAPYDVSWTHGDSISWFDELSSPSVVMTLPSAEMKTAAANAYASVRICAHLSAFFLKVFTLEPLLSHSQGMDPAAKNKYVMSFKQQALGGFSKESDEAVLVRGKAVLLAMTDNPNFVTPEPALETVTEILHDYEHKLSMARRRGSPEDTAAKNDARKATEQMLKRLAFYVTQTADGSLPKLLSSGFPVSSLPQKDDVPVVVTGITLRDGRQQGQMRLDFYHNPSAKVYEYQVCQVDANGQPDEWSESYITSSSRLNIIAPLIPFQRYGVRVRAINGYGRSDWSEMATHVIR